VVGWAAAGAAWVLAGWSWLWLQAVAAGFQLVSLAVLWAVECACDASAARAEGRAATWDTLAFLAAQRPARRRPGPRVRAVQALHWLAGPSRSPVWLRRAVIRCVPARRERRPG
jgi:hypothetical protein